MADGLVAVNSIVPSRVWMHCPSMKYSAFLLVGILALSACEPLTIYHRTGVQVTKMQSDLLECQVDALAKAPVASQIRRGPPRYMPPYRSCSDGHCYRYGGFFYPGEVYTVDLNATLRGQLETQCMATQGYRRVEIPNCPAGTPSAGDGPQTTTLPPLTENSCAIRGQNAAWEIVEPN